MPRTALQHFHFCCACSELKNLTIIARSNGTWTLHPFVAPGSKTPPAIAAKTCPKCGRDFSPYSLDEMTDQLWPARP